MRYRANQDVWLMSPDGSRKPAKVVHVHEPDEYDLFIQTKSPTKGYFISGWPEGLIRRREKLSQFTMAELIAWKIGV